MKNHSDPAVGKGESCDHANIVFEWGRAPYCTACGKGFLSEWRNEDDLMTDRRRSCHAADACGYPGDIRTFA
jgi:hypothetical protein